MAEPLAVALVWHMHQPDYREHAGGPFLLPWVRRRASKDYVRMIETAMRFPELRITMNFVPILLEQLGVYAGDGFNDSHRELSLRDASQLSRADRAFLADFARSTDHPRRVSLFEPYYRLLASLPADAAQLSDQLTRDLQVWSELVWLDPADIRGDPALTALVRRGSDFDEEVKRIVHERQLSRVRAVVPSLRAAIAAGVIEPMTSPFAHPILPLIADQDSALVARPELALPPAPLRLREPGDALAQIERGRAVFERHCGVRPGGMWPPECAVSPEAASLMAAGGARWAISDEEVLARSLGEAVRGDREAMERLYTPYRGPGDLLLVFRDSALSNRIGFDYAPMDADAAVADLVGRLEQIARSRRDGDPWLVVIALDGENCWDHYEDNGARFLDRLYTTLTTSSMLRTTHVGEHLAQHAGAVRHLARLWSGSWIDSDFATWIGEPAHTRAWELLAEARRAIDVAGGPGSRPDAYRELLIAEGSDWFWWFSSRHASGIDSAWDALYRTHLRGVYEALGRQAPAAVDLAISATVDDAYDVPPLRRIDPSSPSDAEWLAAGIASVSGVFGTMQPARSSVDRVRYGASPTHLHLRFGDAPPRFEHARVVVTGAGDTVVGSGRWTVALPLPAEGAVEFHLRLLEAGRGEERVPASGTIRADRLGTPVVAVIAVECHPLAVVGDLAVEVRATVDSLMASGRHCVVILPHHRSLRASVRSTRLPELHLGLRSRSEQARVHQGALDCGATVLTINAPRYFDRASVYGEVDDAERYLVFGRAAFDLLEATRLRPAAVHGFEWQSAVALALLSASDPDLSIVLSSSGVRHLAPAALCRDAGLEVGDRDWIDLLDLGRRSARSWRGESAPMMDFSRRSSE